MVYYLLLRAVSLVGAFLYPAYASFKALKARPTPESPYGKEMERWIMYWSVIGIVIAAEYVAEWFISWFPLYWTAKTLFLLYLALPWTEGSTYVYKTYLHPFFEENEADIDASVAAALGNFISSMRELLLGRPSTQPSQHPGQPGASGDSQAPNQPTDLSNGLAQAAWGLWKNYGPSIAAAGSSLGASLFPSSEETNGRSESKAAPPLPPKTPYAASASTSSTSIPSTSNAYQGTPPPYDVSELGVRRRNPESYTSTPSGVPLPRTPSPMPFPVPHPHLPNSSGNL